MRRLEKYMRNGEDDSRHYSLIETESESQLEALILAPPKRTRVKTRISSLNHFGVDAASRHIYTYCTPDEFVEPLRGDELLEDVDGRIEFCACSLPFIFQGKYKEMDPDASVLLYFGDDVHNVPKNAQIVAFGHRRFDKKGTQAPYFFPIRLQYDRRDDNSHDALEKRDIPVGKLRNLSGETIRESHRLSILHSWENAVELAMKTDAQRRHHHLQFVIPLLGKAFLAHESEDGGHLLKEWVHSCIDPTQERKNQGEARILRVLNALSPDSRVSLSPVLRQIIDAQSPPLTRGKISHDITQTMFLLMVVSDIPYEAGFSTLFRDRGDILRLIRSLDRYGRHIIAREVLRNPEYFYSLDRRSYPIFEMHEDGNSIDMMIDRLGLENTPLMRRKISEVMNQLSFGWHKGLHAVTRTSHFHTYGPDGVLIRVNAFIENFLQKKPEELDGDPTNLLKWHHCRTFARYWSTLSVDDQRRLITQFPLERGGYVLSDLLHIVRQKADTFLHTFYQYEIEGNGEVSPFSPQHVVFQREHIGRAKDLLLSARFTNALSFLISDSRICAILPDRAQRLVDSMKTFLEGYHKGYSGTELRNYVSNQRAISSSEITREIGSSNVFCDLLERLQQLDENLRMESPIVYAWSIFHLADCIRDQKK
jgi:hypothetical protein